MDAKKTAALEVILAALAVRDEDKGAEFPDELHCRLIETAIESIDWKPKPRDMSWLQFAEIICHGDIKRRVQ